MRWIDSALGWVLDKKLDKKQIIFIEQDETHDLLNELQSLKDEIATMHDMLEEFKGITTRLSYEVDSPIELIRNVEKRIRVMENHRMFR